jgi:hypothetical protein
MNQIFEVLKRELETESFQVNAYDFPQKALYSFKPNVHVGMVNTQRTNSRLSESLMLMGYTKYK